MLILIAFGAVVFSTVIVLGIGAAVGYRFGLQARGQILLAPTCDVAGRELELARKLELCQQVVEAVQQRSGTLAGLANDYREVAPPVLIRSIDQLVETTAALAAQLQRDSFFSPPDPARASIPSSVDSSACASKQERIAGPVEPASIPESPPALRSQAETATHVTMPQTATDELATTTRRDERLTADEMQTLAGGVTREIDDSPKQRYQYNCSQIVIPWDDETERPDISRAATVRCDNISVQGVSFFWPDVPDFDRLMISLGTADNPIFMLAEVAHSKTVFKFGEVQVLVGARFTDRHSGQQDGQPLPRPIQPAAKERQFAGV